MVCMAQSAIQNKFARPCLRKFYLFSRSLSNILIKQVCTTQCVGTKLDELVRRFAAQVHNFLYCGKKSFDFADVEAAIALPTLSGL